MFTGDHPAEHRSLSSTPGRKWDTPGSGPVCPSGVPHRAHMSVCNSVFVSTLAGTCTGVCEHACPCVCPRESAHAHGSTLWVCMGICERAHAQLHAHRRMHVCVCLRERVHAQVHVHGRVSMRICVCSPGECRYTGACPSECVWVCLRKRVCAQIHEHRCVHVSVCRGACTWACVCGHESM